MNIHLIPDYHYFVMSSVCFPHQVKKMFAQVVIAMAHHDYLSEEGGQLMVEFVVKQCALSPIDMQVGCNDKRVLLLMWCTCATHVMYLYYPCDVHVLPMWCA